MSKPTIQEMNLTIAEYMGYKLHEDKWGYWNLYLNDEKINTCAPEQPQYKFDGIPLYNENWNVLMEVIQKLKLSEPKEISYEPTDDLWVTVFFDIKKEHEEVYNQIKELQYAK